MDGYLTSTGVSPLNLHLAILHPRSFLAVRPFWLIEDLFNGSLKNLTCWSLVVKTLAKNAIDINIEYLCGTMIGIDGDRENISRCD